MNGKNIYSGNINRRPDFVQDNNKQLQNEKYVATIIAENLRRNSLEKNEFKKNPDAIDVKTKRENHRNEKEYKGKDRTISKSSEDMLLMSVNYDDYDFNQWNGKIADTYNPYAADESSSNAISNYEKIKRIMKQEKQYDKNFEKFANNIDDIYDDIKEKITNETLKIIYGEDNFEYVPNELSEYRDVWTTGDEDADLLLKLYHSPKIKQRDVSAEDYIVQRYNEFVKNNQGKQSWEVEFAKTGINPHDVVRVNLDKAYYMDEVSIQQNKAQQDEYTKAILRNGGKSTGPANNRFGSKPSPFGNKAPQKPTRPPQSTGTIFNPSQASQGNNNEFKPIIDEEDNQTTNENVERVTPRREDWISKNHNEQLIQRSESDKKWDLIKELNNQKFEELIIENGLEVDDVKYDFKENKEHIVLLSIVYEDENKENNKQKVLQKWAKKNKWNLEIQNDEKTNVQKIIFDFVLNDQIIENIVEYKKNNPESNSESVINIDLLGVSKKYDNNEKITNLEELVNHFDNENEEKLNIIDDSLDNENIKTSKQIYNNEQTKKFSKTNVSDNNTTNSNNENKKYFSSKRGDNIEVISSQKRSLADVLAEKRNKNHQQMNSARINKKVSLQEAIYHINENTPNHGPRKNNK